MTKFLNKILDVSVIILLFAILMTISCKYNREDFADLQDSSILENFETEYYESVSDLSQKLANAKKQNDDLQKKIKSIIFDLGEVLLNISYQNTINEFEKLGIDTYAVIEAAKLKYNFQPHFPGPGVGGPCLPVNSYQYLNSSKKIDTKFLKIVKEARQVNESMPSHVVRLLSDAFSESSKSLDNSTIALLGVSYKPNVRDVQIAPSEKIIELLTRKNVTVKIFDPYFVSTTVFGYKTEKSISEAIDSSDAAIIITGHKEFNDLNLEIFSAMKNPILVDCTGKIDPKNAKANGIIFKGIGRGGI